MNWFLYIGGGIVFMVVWCCLFRSYIINVDSLDPANPAHSLFITGIFAVAPLSIWIWICWKVIAS